jgi:hypothetical protein
MASSNRAQDVVLPFDFCFFYVSTHAWYVCTTRSHAGVPKLCSTERNISKNMPAKFGNNGITGPKVVFDTRLTVFDMRYRPLHVQIRSQRFPLPQRGTLHTRQHAYEV